MAMHLREVDVQHFESQNGGESMHKVGVVQISGFPNCRCAALNCAYLNHPDSGYLGNVEQLLDNACVL